MAQHPNEAGGPPDGPLPFCILRRPAQLKALAHPTRAKVLELLIAAPMTSKQLGDRLGMTAARVHYHLKFLERAGLARLVTRRERAGVVEKYYRATSRKYLVSQGIGLFGDPGAVILESLAQALLAGAETAAAGDSVGLVCGAHETVRVPWERIGGLLAVASALEAAEEQFQAIGPDASGGDGGPCFELTYALYASRTDRDRRPGGEHRSTGAGDGQSGESDPRGEEADRR